jgi:hypothetical protein
MFTLSCKKAKSPSDCSPGAPTVRQILNKQATIKVTAMIHPVYIIEDGAIDTKLIPCNFPMEFYQADLRVTISGEVKQTVQPAGMPCCMEYFVITKITR